MKSRFDEFFLSIIVLITILNHVNASVEVMVGKEEIVIREGKEVNLTCTINSTLEALGCSFISPGHSDSFDEFCFNLVEKTRQMKEI